MEELYEKIADILEVDEVTPEDVLTDFDAWDSLSVLSLIAMFDSDYGVDLLADDLLEIKTIADLIVFVENNRK